MRTKLKLLRVRNNLSQDEMSHITGVSRTTYTAIETGERGGSLAFWSKVQTRFEIPSTDMWALIKDYEEN